jgi:hypothetical protein
MEAVAKIVGAGLVVVGGAVVTKRWYADQAASGTPKEQKVVRSFYERVVLVLGVRRVPRLYFAAVANAEYRSDQHVVVINVSWFKQMLDFYCNDDVCVQSVLLGILAHELGHALTTNIDRSTAAGRWRSELAADWHAGRALASLGLPCDDLEHVIAHLSSHGSDTHPPGHQRAEAIRQGYWRGLLTA